MAPKLKGFGSARPAKKGVKRFASIFNAAAAAASACGDGNCGDEDCGIDASGPDKKARKLSDGWRGGDNPVAAKDLMDVIFLDIDGVLAPIGNTGQKCASCGETEEDDGAVFVVLTQDSALKDPSCYACATKHGKETDYATASSGDFGKICLDAFSKIVKATNAQIVLSSTWRMNISSRKRIIQEFKKHDGEVLPKLNKFDYFTTLRRQTTRQWEIGEWLENNGHLVRNWVALDDDTSLSQSDRYKAWFKSNTVETDPFKGLTNSNADKAIRILQRNTSSSSNGKS